MRIDRILVLSLATSLVLLSCGGAELAIVKVFFDALQGGDHDAAARISLVEFPEEVSSWEVVEVGPESVEPFPLETMHNRFLEIEREIESTKTANETFLEANLEIYQEYRRRTDNDPNYEFQGELADFQSELKARLAAQDGLVEEIEQLRQDMKKLRAAATLSLNTAVNERFSGDVKGKQLQLNVNGKAYTFVLKRFELADRERNIAPISRWIITGIEEGTA